MEIIDLIQSYLEDKTLNVEIMGRGFTWFDTGTQNSLLDASNFISSIFNRQRLIIGSPDEVALRLGFIDKKNLVSIYLNLMIMFITIL